MKFNFDEIQPLWGFHLRFHSEIYVAFRALILSFPFFLSVTTASSCCYTRTSAWTSSATTATRWHVPTANRKTHTSSRNSTTATPTSRCSNSSSGHDMRPRWILQNPRHRQKSEAATSPVICRWRTENLTWWEASQAPSGAINLCGTSRTAPTRLHQCKRLTEACAAETEKTPSGSRRNRRR